ncbi:hypothetical protein LCGC14_0451110 [marine sediment metagenome]|uniref:Uncharacterized protein n=1 Tax=marine sediment metagenome TaxID=412755 RepID=A0A0F9SHS1_9ZZZZ
MSTPTGDLGPQHTGPREGACDRCNQRPGTDEYRGAWLCDHCLEDEERADNLQRQEDERMEEQEDRLYNEAIKVARGDASIEPTREHVRVLWDRIVWTTGRIEKMKSMVESASGNLKKAIVSHHTTEKENLGHSSK